MRFAASGPSPVWLLPLLMLGCSVGRGEPTLISDDPALKVPAMKQAVQRDNEKAIPGLITELESSDPAIRMFAIRSLERMTGQNHGYKYYDPEPVRATAVRAWREAFGLPTDPPRTLVPASMPSSQPATMPGPAGATAALGGARRGGL